MMLGYELRVVHDGVVLTAAHGKLHVAGKPIELALARPGIVGIEHEAPRGTRFALEAQDRALRRLEFNHAMLFTAPPANVHGRMGLDVPNAICCLDESETGAVGIINPMGAGYVRGQRDRVKTIARQDGDDHVRYAPKPEAMAASCSRIWEAVLLSAEAISSISCWAFCMFGLKSV